jgi:hypothetical protein
VIDWSAISSEQFSTASKPEKDFETFSTTSIGDSFGSLIKLPLVEISVVFAQTLAKTDRSILWEKVGCEGS